MKKHFFFFYLFIIPCFLYAFEDNDAQYWPRITLESKINKRWKASMDQEFRIGADMSDLYFHRSDFGLVFKASDRVNIGFYYWHSYKQKGETWLMEKRPHVDATLKIPALCKSRMQFRARLEDRNEQNKDIFWVFRNRLLIESQQMFFNNLRPYIADELFFNITESEFNRNRIYAGFKVKCPSPFQFDLYYMLQTDKDVNHWKRTHVLGTKLKISY